MFHPKKLTRRKLKVLPDEQQSHGLCISRKKKSAAKKERNSDDFELRWVKGPRNSENVFQPKSAEVPLT